MLQDETGRHYIGVTSDIDARLQQHKNGGTQTTRRMAGELKLIAVRKFATRQEANHVERHLKSWKSPAKALAYLREG